MVLGFCSSTRNIKFVQNQFSLIRDFLRIAHFELLILYLPFILFTDQVIGHNSFQSVVINYWEGVAAVEVTTVVATPGRSSMLSRSRRTKTLVGTWSAVTIPLSSPSVMRRLTALGLRKLLILVNASPYCVL